MSERPIKLAVSGAHGTGKTTVLTALRDALLEQGVKAQLVPEVPRIVCEAAGDKEFFRRENNSVERQLTLLMGQPVYESSLAVENDVILCDRSIIDHLAYTRYLFGDSLQEQGLDQVVLSLVGRHMQTYDLVFYVPPEIDPIDDGTRESSREFQLVIDEEIRSLLQALDVEYQLLSGSTEKRLLTLTDALAAFRQNK